MSRQHIINYHGNDLQNLNPDDLEYGEIAIVHGDTEEETYIIVKANKEDNK